MEHTRLISQIVFPFPYIISENRMQKSVPKKGPPSLGTREESHPTITV